MFTRANLRTQAGRLSVGGFDVLIGVNPPCGGSVDPSEEKQGAEELFGPLVNFASMAHVVQIDAALFDVQLVKHAVIPDSQLKFGSTFESLVREFFQACAHIIDLALNSITDAHRKGIKCFRERR